MRTMMKRLAVLVVLAAAVQGRAELTLSDKHVDGGFPLVVSGHAAEVRVDAGDAKVVRIAAELLAKDVGNVTGATMQVKGTADQGGGASIIAGTIGQSAVIERLVKEGKVDVSGVKGKWESFVVSHVREPMAGVPEALVVVGSDRRGTAYGLLEISELLGVSPWEWWADVAPRKRTGDLYVTGTQVQGEPSVKYRGIFINDEDFGIQPWAAKTFEPEVGDIGPKTYAKVFELLLRLRANFCWPAMHPSTKAFNLYPRNKQVADDYGIVMGSSHCEPMLRNNVTEWPHDKEKDYNYVTNREGVLAYWRERVKENGKFENVYTLGMRGIHDSDMLGGGTRDERARRLNAIMKDQREMLADLVNKDVAKVPQIFCPYKEVQLLYQAGAVPAPDVTLVWADDNHGYIRNLSTPEEQKRPGGSGVYYHLSYWGRPHDFLWLSTVPPSLVWEELSKAYDYDARNVWVFNVGDIKPAEIDLTLAMQMAYDSKRYSRENIGGFLEAFFAKTFGSELAGEMAGVMEGYYQLNFQRKPEHTGFNFTYNGVKEVQPSTYSDQEIMERLSAFVVLVAQADRIQERVPTELKDAYFELVTYPVHCSALQNQKMLGWEMNRRAAEKKEWAAARQWEEMSTKAYAQIAEETKAYNERIAGGKWRGMMSAAPRKMPVFGPMTYATLPAEVGAAPQSETKSPKLQWKTPATIPSQPHFREEKGYVSIAAEHPTHKVDRPAAAWQVIPDLGRLGDSMAIFPTTAPSIALEKVREEAPALEYAVETTTPADQATLCVQAVPTHRINKDRGLRYAIAVDDEKPQVVDLESAEFSKPWDENVLRGAAYGTTKHKIAPGRHTLHVYMVDPGVVIDHLTIDLGGLPKGYLAPNETLAVKE